MWDDYHVFLIATLVFTRLLLDEIYHHIELPFDWLIDDAMFVRLLGELILGFCYSDFDIGSWWFWELASIIALVVQANQLTKCASQDIKIIDNETDIYFEDTTQVNTCIFLHMLHGVQKSMGKSIISTSCKNL